MSRNLLVVIDSGIWISAFCFGGVPLEAVRLAILEDRLIVCNQIEAEVKRVMLSKFGSPVASTASLLETFLSEAIRVEAPGRLKGICRDPKDDMILECAEQGRADLIVSGDNDLTSLGRYLSIEIIKAREYVDRRRLGSLF